MSSPICDSVHQFSTCDLTELDICQKRMAVVVIKTIAVIVYNI